MNCLFIIVIYDVSVKSEILFCKWGGKRAQRVDQPHEISQFSLKHFGIRQFFG
jgi:hypothetical protein